MTRKDYELIARILKPYALADATTRAEIEQEKREPHLHEDLLQYRLGAIINSFANVLHAENEQFNRDTFLKACGL
jgi:hypothetical protein